MSKKPNEKTVEKIVGKHRFNSLKKAFGLEYAFVDAVLADGTVVKIEPSIEEGATVVVVDSEGGENPAPDGEHQLADGSVIVVEGGVIIQVVAAPEVPVEEEMAAEDGISPELTGILADVANRLKDLESKFKSQTEIVSKLKALEDKVSKFSVEGLAKATEVEALKADLESAKDLVVKMANESVESPLRQPKKTKATMSAEDKDDAVVQNFKSVLFPKK